MIICIVWYGNNEFVKNMFDGCKRKKRYISEQQRRKQRQELEGVVSKLHESKPWIKEVIGGGGSGGRALLYVNFSKDLLKLDTAELTAEDAARKISKRYMSVNALVERFVFLQQLKSKNIKYGSHFEMTYFEIEMANEDECKRAVSLLNEAIMNGKLIMPEHLKSAERTR